jgi:hypothetical protein
MGGRIWVESEYKKGSTFYLEIPRIDHEDATRLIEQASQQAEIISPAKPAVPAAPLEAAVTSPMPTPAVAPETPSDTVISPPADIVAQQLQTLQQQPAPAAATLPVTATPTPQAPNTPLTAIEQNPAQFVQPRPQGINIPIRDPNQQN